MTVTTHNSDNVIRSIAQAAWLKYDGYNLAFKSLGGAVHAITAGDWKGYQIPRTVCPTRAVVFAEDGRRTWAPVDCDRPGCRELQGKAGSEIAYLAEINAWTVHVPSITGETITVPLAACFDVPERRAVLRRSLRIWPDHPWAALVTEGLRRWDTENALGAYADQVAAERAANIARAQQAGMLFDVA